MRRSLWILFMLVGCGDDAQTMVDAPTMQNADGPTCAPQSAVGSFYRRQPNPRIVAGTHTFSDNKVDSALYDPDLLFDGATWHLYYQTSHDVMASIIRHATSADLATWTFDNTPAVAATASAPSVVKMPDGRYLMAYVDELAANTPIVTTISADPASFPAGSPAISKADVYPGVADAVISDPELAVVGTTYHLWFSSRDCTTEPCTRKGIGHATSTNGTTWTVESPSIPSLLRASADPSTGGIAPSVIYDEFHCRYEMWLENDASADNTSQLVDSTAGIWHAFSTNGTSWSISYTQLRDLVVDTTAAGEHLGMRRGADVAIKSGGRYLVYTGFDDQNVPTGYTLPTKTGSTPGVMTLDLATRDAQ